MPAFLFLAILAFASALSADTPQQKTALNYLQAETNAERAAAEATAHDQATATASALKTAVDLADKRHAETIGKEEDMTMALHELLNQGADIRQLVMANEDARQRRVQRAARLASDAVLAERLNVIIACSLVLNFGLLGWIITAIRHQRNA